MSSERPKAPGVSYQVRRKAGLKTIRITVRADSISVSAPRFTPARAIEAFVQSKGEWIARKQKALRERPVVAAPERFVDGARVPFRGKSYKLKITRNAPPPGSVRFARRFEVSVPAGLGERRREERVRRLVMGWLRDRALADARGWSRRYGARLGAYPQRIRIGDQKTLWGSCSARGTISLNWRLVALPKPIFEYVVVHELCHLVEHNHGPGFWNLVDSLLPDYRERRAWLKQRGVGLG